MTDLAVQFEGISKSYPFFSLEQIGLEVPTGTITGLIGANGAGKSTTLRILMGLVQPDQGSVRVLGHDMAKNQVAAKLNTGFVSEDIRLYKGLTLAWHIEFIRSLFGQWDAQYCELLLKRFDLQAERKIGNLSRGQRTKAMLLLALARRPRLLVLDEPTAGLDPIARREVLRALAEVLADEKRTVLFSSQNTLDVEQISDQITFIDRGRIVDSADKESLLESWRSIRVRVPSGVTLPPLSGVTREGGTARVVVFQACPFEPTIIEALQGAGATVEAVERMTLEEIFVACVMREREDMGA
jgi:ABC-2 type transport system ATP-binding protein